MKIYILLFSCIFILSACTSPHKIVLRDDSVIYTRDEVSFNRRTGFYEYTDVNGKKVQVNSAEVTFIQKI